MKVLWFSVTPLSLNTGDNTGVEGKGWISSLLQLALAIEGLELVVAYENYSPNKKETEESERLKIVPINICRYSKREIIKDMMTKKEVDEYILSESLKIADGETGLNSCIWSRMVFRTFGQPYGHTCCHPYSGVVVTNQKLSAAAWTKLSLRQIKA